MNRKVGQVVLVVIDALRADFVLPDSEMVKLVGSGFKTGRPKIQSLHDAIQNPKSDSVLAFVAEANSPTVTMPRIKVRHFDDFVCNSPRWSRKH